MKKNRSMVNMFVQASVFAFALSAVGCASKQVASSSSSSQNNFERDGNGVAQGTTEAEISTSKPKAKNDRRESTLIRVPHGRSKSP